MTAKKRTLSDQIKDIIDGKKTAKEIIENEEVDGYGIRYFEISKGEGDAYRELYAEWEKTREEKKPVAKTIKYVMCGCGHECPEAQVMNASLGTSCPDCYDKMSD